MSAEKHIFSICAYKESPYLEKCVKSIINQSCQSKVIMCTSTPCEYISDIAKRYNIPLYIRDGKSDIRDDWNFAYNSADSEFVTIAHQDDVYSKRYVEVMMNKINKAGEDEDIIMYYTDYLPLKGDNNKERDINSKLRRILRIPMKSRILSKSSWWRKITLAFGNSICCPTVTYNKEKLGESVFTSEYKFNIDWDTFLKLAKLKGRFVYADTPLVCYRVHDGATSKEFIENNLRIDEDTRMFKQFWPGIIAKLIMIPYKKAYDTYNN